MNQLASVLGERLMRNESLAKYTAARLGGPADFLYIAKSDQDELMKVLEIGWEQDLPIRIIGGGANILVSDNGIRGLVIVNHLRQIKFDETHVFVKSGTSLSTLARQCQVRGLSGFEWTISVPGTVGGAIVNNAGAHGSDIAKNLEWVRVLTPDKGLETYLVSDMDYAYRNSILKSRPDQRFFVMDAMLMNLCRNEPALIQWRMQEFVSFRKRTQPPGASLGSIFKNPEGDFAGRLIEICNLKGYTIGGAQVSPIHANFFVNSNHATASDYLALIHHVQHVIFEQTGIRLELEVEILGD